MEPNIINHSFKSNKRANKDFENISNSLESFEMAEKECATLKQQLDYMRTLYQDSEDYLINSTQNISKTNQKLIDDEILEEKDTVGSIVNIKNNPQLKNYSKKVTVIKNLLTGINNTVNRISKLSVENKSKRMKEVRKSHSRETTNVHKPKLKNKEALNRPSSVKSQIDKKRNLRGKKLHRTFSNRTNYTINNRIGKNQYKEKLEKNDPNKIIEIYHNNALKLKECPSEETCIENKDTPNDNNYFQNSYEEDACHDPKNSLKNYENEEKVPARHFLEPTFASKQKQVDRSLFNETSKLSFNKIPFVAGMATTRSHNLGMNIQQVLSIIKLKQLQQSNVQINSKENLQNLESNIQNGNFEGKISENSPINGQRNKSNYKEILSNYIKNSTSLSFLKDDKMKRFSILNYQSSDLLNTWIENDLDNELNIHYLKPKFYRNIKGRIRGVREVLNSLYADYLRLNRIYKKIYQEIVEEHFIDYKLLKSLDSLEEELQAKEDEISVVMCLFKQVIELKEQVSNLRQKSLQMELPSNENHQDQEQGSTNLALSCRRYNKESNATLRLTRLLRTIQKFQNKLKCQEHM